jgi:hypothetical protein
MDQIEDWIAGLSSNMQIKIEKKKKTKELWIEYARLLGHN